MTVRSDLSPLDRCLRKVDHASVVTDTSVVGHLREALDELEAAYAGPSERVVALESVIQEFKRRRWQTSRTPLGRFLETSVESRQDKVAERYL